jgi:tRNA-splicing ligase RtcB
MKLGYPEGRAIGMAINTVHKFYKRAEKDEIVEMLKAVLLNPKEFIQDSIWNKVAQELVPAERKSLWHELRKNRVDYRIF